MEITLLPKGGIRLKGKQATLTVDSVADLATVNGGLFLTKLSVLPESETLIIDGPGDYEVGGVKISSLKTENDLLYSVTIDSIEVFIGEAKAAERIQNKLKEHHIVLLHTPTVTDVAFIAGMTPSVLMFYGAQGQAVADKTGKESLQTMNKYAVTLDKLPLEMATILLASS